MDKQIGSGLTSFTWPRVTLENISVSGNTIELYTTTGLFIGQKILLRKNSITSDLLIISRVWDARFITVKTEKQADLVGLQLSLFAGGILDAPEQERSYPEGTEPGRMAFSEEPVLAFRNALVSHHGNMLTTQSGNLDIDYPEARFVYDCQYNLREIREFVRDPMKGYEGLMRTSASPSGIAIPTTPLPFMAANPSSLLYYETLPDGTKVNETTYSIIGFNDYQNTFFTNAGDLIFTAASVFFNAPAPEYLLSKRSKYFQMTGSATNLNQIFEISSSNLSSQFNQTTAVTVSVNHITGKITFPLNSSVPDWLKITGNKFKPSNGLNSGIALTVSGYNPTLKEVSVTGLTASESILMNYTIFNQIDITGSFISGNDFGQIDSRFAFISVSPAPPANTQLIARLDGSLGDKTKITKFSYGCALEITRIASEYKEVNGDDIYTRDTDPC